MSSAGNLAGGGPLSGGQSAPQQYYCYQCERIVSIAPSPSSDLLCPRCSGGFLEEYENPNPNPNPDPDPFSTYPDSFSSLLAGLPFLLSPSATDPQNPRNFATLFAPQSQQGSQMPAGFDQDPDAFNPLLFLQNYIQSMRIGNANLQVVFEDHPSDRGFRLPGNVGDYFFGPGLEQLIQQLAENDPNRYGTPPASKSAIEKLPDISVTEELMASDLAQCAVCMSDFERGMKVKEMPCKHIYHPDCILPWLELHNSCPVCRYELPTDDPDYENIMQGVRGSGSPNVASGDSGNGGMHSQSQGQETQERRFTISLPWPFSAFGSRADNNEGGGRSNNGGSHSDSGRNRTWGDGLD